MPIYAYKCESCGFAKDVLQKISDPVLTGCPSCGAAEFKKQVTAAGFQLKGSGWYVTDFRGGTNGGEGSSAPASVATSQPAPAESSKTEAAAAPAVSAPVSPPSSTT